MFSKEEAQELIELNELKEVSRIEQLNDNLFSCSFLGSHTSHTFTTGELKRIKQNNVYDKMYTNQDVPY